MINSSEDFFKDAESLIYEVGKLIVKLCVKTNMEEEKMKKEEEI